MPRPPKYRVQFRMRIHTGQGVAIGPGKIALLEAIVQTGSITGAARQMGMSYRRAWLLVDDLNRAMRSPAVRTATGGARGGGTSVTAAGHELIRRYRSVEATAERMTASDLDAIKRLLAL